MKIHEVTYMDGDERRVISLDMPAVESIEFAGDYKGGINNIIKMIYSDGIERCIYNPCYILIGENLTNK